MNPLPAMPGQVHPAYEPRSVFIQTWLDTPGGPYGQHIRIPREPSPEATSADVGLLTRRTARGPAPYVGRPFGYQWYVGEDQQGRMVAGNRTWLKYTQTDDEYARHLPPVGYWVPPGAFADGSDAAQ